jgi:monoamine oxidase
VVTVAFGAKRKLNGRERDGTVSPLGEAGYKVRVLEFNHRPGGRNWTLRGGDTFTELGGLKQSCEFEEDVPTANSNRLTIARESVDTSF